jgi:hypothetical protein
VLRHIYRREAAHAVGVHVSIYDCDMRMYESRLLASSLPVLSGLKAENAVGIY